MVSNRWTFVVNNPEEWRPVYDERTMDYLVWQHEIAPTTGTPHIQGYVRFKCKKRMTTVKSTMPIQVHLEQARADEEQNRTYCTKEGGTETTELGTYDPEQGRQGRRTDLRQAVQTLQRTNSLTEVAVQHPETFVRYHNGLGALHRALRPPPPPSRDIIAMILWGPTNVGKTHRIRSRYPGIYTVVAGRGPFDTYHDQEVVLFDEFRPDDWQITDMNRYLDKWPCDLNCRFYNRTALWTRVFICANKDPDSWWPNDNYLLRDAFFRRVLVIYEITNKEDIIIL